MQSVRTSIAVFTLMVICSVWVYTQTQNTVPKYGASGTLVNSSITDNGNNVMIGTPGAYGAHLSVAGNSPGGITISALLDSDDTVGVRIERNASTAYPNAMLQFCNTDTGVLCSYVYQSKVLGGISLLAGGASAPQVHVTESGNVGIGTTTAASKLHVVGNVTVDGNIGAKYQDVAEWVDVVGAAPPGSVVRTDPDRANHVRQSDQAYDTAVAGVVSPRPGVLLGEAGRGKVAVAQSGRVRVRVDATTGTIKPGDLLVTSDRRGYAMRSDPVTLAGVTLHRPGTILGKALEPLDSGQGEILVLLTLQ
jgi:hypothetical protein